MNQGQLVGWVRGLVAHLRSGGEFTDQFVSDIEGMQEALTRMYDSYEQNDPPEMGEVLREFMLEALQLIHHGLEDLLDYGEEPDDALLDTSLASVEEGNDVLDSLRYAIEQDTSWTSSAAMG